MTGATVTVCSQGVEKRSQASIEWGKPADNVTGEALQNILARYLPMALIPGTQVADASKTIWVCPTAAYLVQNNQQYQQTYGCNMGVHINYSYPNPTFALCPQFRIFSRYFPRSRRASGVGGSQNLVVETYPLVFYLRNLR